MGFLLQNSFGLVVIIALAAFYIYILIAKKTLPMTAKYAETRVYKVQKDELLEMARQALIQAKFKHIEIEGPGSSLKAKAGISIFSWSELLEIDLENRIDGVALEFRSVCAMPVQIVDWVKNKDNSGRFFRELEKNILNNSGLRAA